MKKRILIAAVGLIALILVLGAVKGLQIKKMVDQGKSFVPPPETVTTYPAKTETWETSLSAVGGLTAVQGVTVSAELSGKVAKISFEPGSAVKKGDILVRQDTSTEEAQLPGALAQAELTRTNLERAEQLFSKGMISRVDLDVAKANAEQAKAQAENIRTLIAKKTIRAPFSGHLGIRQVNLGQMMHEGDPIVTLQTLDPIFADFSLPQQQISQLRQGLRVRVTGDALSDDVVNGKITAISPLVDADSRSIRIQATLPNSSGRLRPGMFVNISVGLPKSTRVLVIPATSVLYAPYSDSVFVVEDDKGGKTGQKVLRQQFVRLGEKRGDLVAVTEGLKEGESVVSTGVFKLRNGQSVVIDNKLSPEFRVSPKPENN